MTDSQSRITLKFDDPELESSYQQHAHPATLRKFRVSMGLLSALYAVFAVIDPIAFPDSLDVVLAIRFALTLPFLAVAFVVSFVPAVQKRMQQFVFGVALVVGALLSAIIANGSGAATLYVPGSFGLLIIWAYVVSGLNHINATWYCCAILAMHAVVNFALSPVAIGVYAYTLLQLSSALTIGLIAAYLLEFNARRSYARTRDAERANSRLGAVVNTAVDAIITSDRTGQITAWNPAAERIFGHAANDAVGKPIKRVLPEFDVHAEPTMVTQRGVMSAAQAGEITETTGIRKDGEVFNADLATARWQTDGNVAFTVLVRDITERKQVERSLGRRTLEARLLHHISETTTASTSTDEALTQIVDLVCKEIGWPVGHVYQSSPHHENLLLSTDIWHLGDPDAYAGFVQACDLMTFEKGVGLPGRAFASLAPDWITDLQQIAEPNNRSRAAITTNLRGAFAIPVHTNTDSFAVLEFFSHRALDGDKDLEQIMRNVGDQINRVLERRRNQQELKLAQEEAERANQAKTAFLANMSHELRTPMNAILGYSEMLLEETNSPELEDFAEDLKKIQGAGTHLLALINDVLDLSKIEAGKLDVVAATFDVAELVELAAATAQPLMQKKHNTMSISCPESVGEACQDATKVRQALLNLLSNAAKFTENSIVSLHVSREPSRNGDEWLRIDVEDFGIGIPEDKIDRVFDEFGQAEDSTARDYGGTGLGLPISRRFCRIMGGDLTVASKQGEGSTFTIRIPIFYRR